MHVRFGTGRWKAAPWPSLARSGAKKPIEAPMETPIINVARKAQRSPKRSRPSPARFSEDNALIEDYALIRALMPMIRIPSGMSRHRVRAVL